MSDNERTPEVAGQRQTNEMHDMARPQLIREPFDFEDESQVQVGERPLYAVDFSYDLWLLTESTLLRRLWLVDPEAVTASITTQPGFDSTISLSNETFNMDAKAIFMECTRRMRPCLPRITSHELWDDDVWMAQSDFKLPLLAHPIGASDASRQDVQASVFSPLRREIYPAYDQIFASVYETLKAQAGPNAVGEFRPPNSTVMLLDIPVGGPADLSHSFKTDTFVYPVWIAPGTELTFTARGDRDTMASNNKTWRSALWCKGGVQLTISARDAAGAPASGVVAVLALGQCEHRPLVAKTPIVDDTIERLLADPVPDKMPQAPRMPWDDDPEEDPKKADKDAPVSMPEADHLARAIFLQAGDAVESCAFGDMYSGIEQEKPVSIVEGTDKNNGSIYSPLPGNNSIRILTIDPSPSEDAPLQTSLTVVSLADKPAFDAISYTWGDPADKMLLNCNGSTVPIPCNLRDTLARLRDPARPRYVWADSVCINQDDIAERGQQVSIMRDIYQGAERVIVWLGLDNDNQAATAFQAVCDIVRRWRPAHADRFHFASYAGHLEPMPDRQLAHMRTIISHTAWDALHAMFETGYFRRFWIIQELALGASSILLWGKHHIAWGLVGICAAWILTAGWNFPSNALGITRIPAAYNAFLIYALPLARKSAISPFSKLDLAVILGTTVGRFDATDARDRIFALLGMPFAGNDPSSSTNLLLTPDYTQPTSAVYLLAAKRILAQDQHLRLLSAVQHGPGLDTTQPSWVPNWSKPYHAEPLALRDEQGYYANGGELFVPSPTTFLSPKNQKPTLNLTGLLISPILSPSEELLPGKIHFSALSSPVHQTLMQHLFNHLNNEENQYRASWSATLERFTLWGFTSPQIQAERFAAEAYRHVAVYSQPGKYGMRMSWAALDGERAQVDHLGEFLLYWRERAGWSAARLEHESMEGFWRAMDVETREGGSLSYVKERALCSFNTMVGRRVFTCADGKYYGLGPAAMREGDVVVVLFGGVVPFVLRRVGGEDGEEEEERWRLVGECFVPGLMQGEAVEAAGLLAPGTFERLGSRGALTIVPRVEEGEEDPRLHRRVGEFGVRAFAIQ
ncbi:heterokaryon incompatibility protein-domain-containing protein [Cercophora scortea]|uniref:Heterokaryon incompatibility protein-domain-containing protein n=1 Tax=Cercophora scortea TaxID=314031 RepID=A0AAE0M5S7_9PEZI|nr:heterokaryon incompatibility protein-domain-containing protein [Cercophora scortea]